MRNQEPRALPVSYNPTIGHVVVKLANGCIFSFPHGLVEGLQQADKTELASVEVLGNGTGLHWEGLDLSLQGLLSGIFGTKAYLAQHAGRTRSPAKAAAAKKNGRKGGRPRKALSFAF